MGGRSAGRSGSRSSSSIGSMPVDRTVSLWMSDGGRPPAAPPADVTVLIKDRVLGTVRVGPGGGFSEYAVPIPADVAAAAAATGEPVRITLRTADVEPARGPGHAGRPGARRDGRSRGGKIANIRPPWHA